MSILIVVPVRNEVALLERTLRALVPEISNSSCVVIDRGAAGDCGKFADKYSWVSVRAAAEKTVAGEINDLARQTDASGILVLQPGFAPARGWKKAATDAMDAGYAGGYFPLQSRESGLLALRDTVRERMAGGPIKLNGVVLSTKVLTDKAELRKLSEFEWQGWQQVVQKEGLKTKKLGVSLLDLDPENTVQVTPAAVDAGAVRAVQTFLRTGSPDAARCVRLDTVAVVVGPDVLGEDGLDEYPGAAREVVQRQLRRLLGFEGVADVVFVTGEKSAAWAEGVHGVETIPAAGDFEASWHQIVERAAGHAGLLLVHGLALDLDLKGTLQQIERANIGALLIPGEDANCKLAALWLRDPVESDRDRWSPGRPFVELKDAAADAGRSYKRLNSLSLMCGEAALREAYYQGKVQAV